MAFDREDPAHLAALKDEVNTDPEGYNYDPTDTAGVLKKISQNLEVLSLQSQ